MVRDGQSQSPVVYQLYENQIVLADLCRTDNVLLVAIIFLSSFRGGVSRLMPGLRCFGKYGAIHEKGGFGLSRCQSAVLMAMGSRFKQNLAYSLGPNIQSLAHVKSRGVIHASLHGNWECECVEAPGYVPNRWQIQKIFANT